MSPSRLLFRPHSQRVTRLLAAGVLSVAFCLTGCPLKEELPPLFNVQGTATHKGNPLSQLRISFTPEKGDRGSTGNTDPLGKFTLSYKPGYPGVLGGKHKVHVRYLPATPEEEKKQAQPGYTPPAPYDVIVKKYGDPETTPKTVEITAETLNLELKLD